MEIRQTQPSPKPSKLGELGTCFLLLECLHPMDAEKTCILGLGMPLQQLGPSGGPGVPRTTRDLRGRMSHMPWVVWWLRPPERGAHLLQPLCPGRRPHPITEVTLRTPQRSDPAGAWSFVSQPDPQKLKTHRGVFPIADGLSLSSLKFQFH